MKKMIIVGCGPKAVAIAAKAFVLQGLGWAVPEIVIIDRHGPASNWNGMNGYTDGTSILGTTPLEDVGFPYESQIDRSVDTEMLKLSYMAYLIDIGEYAEWVDRSQTPPSHAMLANYLKWVIEKIDFHVTIGEVMNISSTADHWTVAYQDEANTKQITGDALVITGPGNPYRFPRTEQSLEDSGRVFNGLNVWHHIQQFKDMQNQKIAVIGGGETAAGIVTTLLDLIDASTEIEIITRHPIIFTRNENWREVMYFSKVMDWSDLTDQQKIEIIRHADRGTFSVAAKNLMDAARNVNLKLGDVKKLEVNDEKVHTIINVNSGEQKNGYDYVIEATGFDPLSFTKFFSDSSTMHEPKSLYQRIEPDMSVADVKPKLHLPGLSAMAQGPGFPNLSCLGLLSDRILATYVRK